MNLKKSVYQFSLSFYTIILVVVTLLAIDANQKPWKNNTVIGYDIVSYYAYLPAFFIEKDITLSFINDSNAHDYANKSQYWPIIAPNGGKVIKTSMGMAIMYAPAFLVAHGTAAALGYEASGFSKPYHMAVQLSGLLYLFLGLLVLRKVLRIYFSEAVVAFTLFVVVFGTNLLCYGTLLSPYSHQYSFFLFSLLVYGTQKWHQQSSYANTLIIGFSLGMLTLVRPINISFILIFILYRIGNLNDLVQRILIFLREYKKMLLIALTGVLIFLPQLLYWKTVTGNYFFFSYQGERFYFTNPHLLQCLFGFRKGWLIYTPVMLAVFPGFYLLFKSRHHWALGSFILLVVHVYLISSWWCWWYGGSFGLRPMIDIYPVLIFPLAIVIHKLLTAVNAFKIAGITVIVLLAALNLFQTVQFHYNIIHYDSMTREAYFNRFFATSGKQVDRNLLKRPNYPLALQGIDGELPYLGE